MHVTKVALQPLNLINEMTDKSNTIPNADPLDLLQNAENRKLYYKDTQYEPQLNTAKVCTNH